MKQTSTALIEARLEYMTKRHPKEPSAHIWSMVFFEMERLDEVKAYLDFGFNPESPSSSQLINQNMQSQFGSDLYILFAQHGRNPHTLRDTKTLIFSLYKALSNTDPNARFSLSDIGMGIHTNMPISWSKLREMDLLDWNKPCAQYKTLTIYPAELALIEGNVSLAHRILGDGGKIHTSEVFPNVVQGFFRDVKSNCIVRHKVWMKLLAFNSTQCAQQLQFFAQQHNWSDDERLAFEGELLAPAQMVKKAKQKTIRPAQPENTDGDKRRQYFVNLLLKVGQWDALKDVLASGNPRYFDIAESIYEKEECSLNVLDADNPLTKIVQHICSTKNTAGLRFFLNKGLRGDQVVNRETGDTVLHLWLTGHIHLLTKDYMQAANALLKSTKNVSVFNNNGETCLFSLVSSNYYASNTTVQPIIEIMVAKGLDVRVRNNKNQTASEFLFAKAGDTMLGSFLRNMEIAQDKNALLDAVQTVQGQSNKRRM